MRKKKLWDNYTPKNYLKKLLLIMKLTTVIALVTAFQLSASVYSQNTKISVNVQGGTFSDVIQAIEEQSEFKIFYKNEQIDLNRPVNFRANKESVADILNKTLESTDIKYTLLNKIIVLSPEDEKLTTQDITIKGKITDIDGIPLPGVNIVEKGTTNGTVSDLDGNYSITVSSPDVVLSFSFVGFLTEDINVAGRTIIDVTLGKDIKSLEEVVVIGYGTQRKGDITSSVASVKQEEFMQGSTQDVGQLIQGRVAGLSIISESGDPTANTQILLRGTNSLNGTNTSPLILIDGVPGDFNSVAAEDIVSIDVLKDGSAAAIYGTQGANGVIIITTKRASGQYANKVSYSGYVTTSQIIKEVEMSSASDARQQIEDGYRDGSYDLGATTDWLDEITRTPFSHVHNLSFQGGNSQTNYLFNINYKALEGIFLKSDNNVANARIDINHYMFNNKVKINLGAITRNIDYNTTGDGYSFNGYTYRQAKIYNPTAPLRDDNGDWTESPGAFNYDNPVARLKESDGNNKSQWGRVNGTISYEPVQGLIFKSLLSFSRFNETRGYYETSSHISTKRSGLNGYASNGSTQTTDRLIELTVNYAKSQGQHRFKILGGYSYKDFDEYIFWQRNVDFPTNQFGYYNIGLGNGLTEGNTTTQMHSERTLTNLIAFFGRATYSYADKYLFMGSLRYEAASQLYGSENPWGFFPGASFGWRISKEAFMADINFVDDLKLRIGYGVTGTQPSESFLAVSTFSYNGYYYSNQEWEQTLKPLRNANPDLKWEERTEYNIGLDYVLQNNRIYGAIDYYNRKVDGLLFEYEVPVPPNLVNTTMANVGIMRNKGIELSVNVVPVRRNDFEWITSFNFSTNKNELESLSNDLYESSTGYINEGETGEPIQTYTHRIKEGGPVGNYYGFKVIDITEDGKWIYEDNLGNHVYSTTVGEITGYYYEDEDGSLVLSDFSHSDSDKKVLGNGLPKYYMGWNNTFKYKNFDLTVGMRGAFDFEILNFERMYLENPTVTEYNRMKSAFNKLYGKAVLDEALEFNSYYIENGNYWKIDNITLGYDFEMKNVNGISSARVYVSSRNTYTITNYKGLDPEVQADGLEPGNDYRDKYPTTRNFTIGVNVNF